MASSLRNPRPVAAFCGYIGSLSLHSEIQKQFTSLTLLLLTGWMATGPSVLHGKEQGSCAKGDKVVNWRDDQH